MADFALWPSRSNYQRFRETMDDGDKYPATFDEWEKKAESHVAELKAHGIIIKPVPFDREKFIAFCRKEALPCGRLARGLYGVEVGTARGLH